MDPATRITLESLADEQAAVYEDMALTDEEITFVMAFNAAHLGIAQETLSVAIEREECRMNE